VHFFGSLESKYQTVTANEKGPKWGGGETKGVVLQNKVESLLSKPPVLASTPFAEGSKKVEHFPKTEWFECQEKSG